MARSDQLNMLLPVSHSVAGVATENWMRPGLSLGTENHFGVGEWEQLVLSLVLVVI